MSKKLEINFKIQINQEAEKFYVSLGLYPMTKTFWKKSMLEKPLDRSVECYASAFDFSNQFDFRYKQQIIYLDFFLNFNIFVSRIKMCTSIDLDNFFTVHHEMGNVLFYYTNTVALFDL